MADRPEILLSSEARSAHPAVCAQVPYSQAYSNKNYSAAFKCPVCGRQQRRNLNFLGGRYELACDGKKFTRQPKPRFATLAAS